MRVTWTPRAAHDLATIVETIAESNKSAATKLYQRIFSVVEKKITETPYIGRQGRISGTREFVVHASYILVYRVAEDKIEIVSLRHTRRLWPKRF